jgi:hypothetical protein
VFVPRAEANKVKRAGSYQWRGDIVEVVGVFHKASPEQGGEMMIKARSLRLVKRGFRLEHRVSRLTLIAATILLLAAEGILLLSKKLGMRPGPRFLK